MMSINYRHVNLTSIPQKVNLTKFNNHNLLQRIELAVPHVPT